MLVGVASLPHSRPLEHMRETSKTAKTFATQCICRLPNWKPYNRYDPKIDSFSVFSQLMGNPSDGFNGKTISLSIKNFWAEVTIFESARLSLIPHPLNDPTEFGSLGTIHILRHIYQTSCRVNRSSLFKWLLLQNCLKSMEQPCFLQKHFCRTSEA